MAPIKTETRLDYQTRLQVALRWLEEHQAEEITPAQLAQVAGFSPYHFHRVFRGMLGESVMQRVRRLRLESAAQRLRRSDDSVIDIALAAGFESHEGFTRAFKEHFGAPPQQWRKQPSERLQALAHEPLLPREVDLRKVPAMHFLCMSHQGSFDDIAVVWQQFVSTVLARGLFSGREQLVGRYPDDPEITPPGKVRFDVGMLLNNALTVPAEPPLRQETLPAGEWAVALHRGSYTALSDTYLRLVGGWFPQAGHALDDRPCLEFYLNSPSNTAEADLLTEVWAPVKSARDFDE
jgi:AraC family transcriptional regulator